MITAAKSVNRSCDVNLKRKETSVGNLSIELKRTKQDDHHKKKSNEDKKELKTEVNALNKKCSGIRKIKTEALKKNRSLVQSNKRLKGKKFMFAEEI